MLPRTHTVHSESFPNSASLLRDLPTTQWPAQHTAYNSAGPLRGHPQPSGLHMVALHGWDRTNQPRLKALSSFEVLEWLKTLRPTCLSCFKISAVFVDTPPSLFELNSPALFLENHDGDAVNTSLTKQPELKIAYILKNADVWDLEVLPSLTDGKRKWGKIVTAAPFLHTPVLC